MRNTDLEFLTNCVGPELVALGPTLLLGPASADYHGHVLLGNHLPEVLGGGRQWTLARYNLLVAVTLSRRFVETKHVVYVAAIDVLAVLHFGSSLL